MGTTKNYKIRTKKLCEEYIFHALLSNLLWWVVRGIVRVGVVVLTIRKQCFLKDIAEMLHIWNHTVYDTVLGFSYGEETLCLGNSYKRESI